MGFDVDQAAYVQLRDLVAERTVSFVFWVGAGLSQPLGIPGWAGLKTSLVSALRKNVVPQLRFGQVVSCFLRSILHKIRPVTASLGRCAAPGDCSARSIRVSAVRSSPVFPGMPDTHSLA